MLTRVGIHFASALMADPEHGREATKLPEEPDLERELQPSRPRSRSGVLDEVGQRAMTGCVSDHVMVAKRRLRVPPLLYPTAPRFQAW
jgi:hypothetical protein